MPETDPKDFDLRLRSLLEEAEARPSRRVWRAVSRRLDAEAAPAPAANPWRWAGWAGVTLAAAAATVAGIFLFDPIPTYHNIQKEETLAQVVEIQQPEVTVSGEQPVEQVETVKSSPARKAVKPVPVDIVPASEPAERDMIAQVLETPAEQPEAPVAETPVPAAEEPKEKEEAASAANAFARMAWEDSHKAPSRPTQLFVAGSLGGNESDITVASRASRLSSSVEMAKTGITELGDSSYGIPFTVGVGARFYLTDRFSLGTGIDYTLLTRSFEGKYNNVSGGIIQQTASGTFFHAMHYIGIPLNAYYDFISGGKVKFYGYAGGAAEYCLANRYNLYSEKFTYSEPVKGLQWSVGAGLGVQFRLTDFLGVYIDPGVRYFFDCNQPKSVRTEHPVLINFDAGLRFEF